jgi:hypothetical protein
MQKLDELGKKLSLLPTVIDFNDEILIIRELMRLGDDDISENRDLFIEIVRRVELSHTDSGYFELTPENEIEFIGFYKWLLDLERCRSLGLSEDIIENFNMTSRKFARLMSTK